jgi:hypothetical protein
VFLSLFFTQEACQKNIPVGNCCDLNNSPKNTTLLCLVKQQRNRAKNYRSKFHVLILLFINTTAASYSDKYE